MQSVGKLLVSERLRPAIDLPARAATGRARPAAVLSREFVFAITFGDELKAVLQLGEAKGNDPSRAAPGRNERIVARRAAHHAECQHRQMKRRKVVVEGEEGLRRRVEQARANH